MALSAGQQALLDVTAAFDAANQPDVQMPALLHAGQEMLKLYDLMFPSKGRVYDILKGDHAGHLKSLQRLADADRAAHPDAGDAVFPMLDREVAKKGLPPVRNDLCSGVCSLLWFMRTVRFLGRFLDLLCDPAHAKQDAFECARAAYKECLYPYHRMVVSMIVPLALGARAGACCVLAGLAGLRGAVSWVHRGASLTDLLTGGWLTTPPPPAPLPFAACVWHCRRRGHPREPAQELWHAHAGGGVRVHRQVQVSWDACF